MKSLINRDADVNSASSPVAPTAPDATNVTPTTPTDAAAPVTPQPPVDIPATVELEQFDTPSPMNEAINFDAVVIKFQSDLQSLNQLDLFQAQRFCTVSTTKEYSFVVDANKVTVTEMATGATKEIVLEYAKNLADVI